MIEVREVQQTHRDGFEDNRVLKPRWVPKPYMYSMCNYEYTFLTMTLNGERKTVKAKIEPIQPTMVTRLFPSQNIIVVNNNDPNKHKFMNTTNFIVKTWFHKQQQILIFKPKSINLQTNFKKINKPVAPTLGFLEA